MLFCGQVLERTHGRRVTQPLGILLKEPLAFVLALQSTPSRFTYDLPLELKVVIKEVTAWPQPWLKIHSGQEFATLITPRISQDHH